MARPLRIEFPGAWYHVSNRGARQQEIFSSNECRKLFLDLLMDLKMTFGVEISAYCLLPGCYHLLINTPRANLSLSMRHLNGVYTQRYNQSMGVDGPLFRGRYKSIVVDPEHYLLPLSRYLHWTPVEAKLVKAVERYPWSSYAAYVGRVDMPPWLAPEPVMGFLGTRNTRDKYAAYVKQGVDEELAHFYARGRIEPVLGGEAFRREIARGKKSRAGRGQNSRSSVKPPSIDSVVKETARAFDISSKELREKIRGRGKTNLPRSVAIYLSRIVGAHPLQKIADAFDLGHYASVSTVVRRIREQIQEDRVLSLKVDRICRVLQAG